MSLSETFLNGQNIFFDLDRIPLILFALLLSAAYGVFVVRLNSRATPLLWFILDDLFGRAGDKLDRKERGSGDLMFRGIVFLLAVLSFVVAVSFAAEFLLLVFPLSSFFEALLLSLCLSNSALLHVLRVYYSSLEQRNPGPGTYLGISRTARVDLNSTDEFGIARVGVGLCARSFDKALMAPIVWYFMGGLVAVAIYATAAAFAWRFGKDGFTKGFGKPALYLEKVMGILPSMLSAVVITMASVFTPTATIFQSLKSWAASKGNAPYEQGGYPLTALAWALDISLGGPVKDYSGSTIKSAWVWTKGGSAKVKYTHMTRALYIYGISHLLLVAILLVIYTWERFI